MIQIAQNNIEEMQAYKLRHAIYIEELGRVFLSKNKEDFIRDARDKNAAILIAKNKEDNVIGTLRVNISTWSTFLEEKYGIEFTAKHITYAIVDNFVLAKHSRNTKLALRFILKVFKYGIERGTDLCLIESATKLLELYLKLGFTVYRTIYKHGNLRYQLYLEPFDLIHLKHSNSIFYPIMKRHHEPVFA